MKSKNKGSKAGALLEMESRSLAPWVERQVHRMIGAAGSEGMDRAQVVEAVVQIIEERGVEGVPTVELVAESLANLRSSGRLVVRDQRWFQPSCLGLKRGRLERTGGRFFRVRDLEVAEPTFYEVKPRDLEGARQGDSVLFKPSPTSTSGTSRRAARPGRAGGSGPGRSGKRRPATGASIEKVVQQGSRTWVGLLQQSAYGMEFTPFDHRLRFDARELDLGRLDLEGSLRDYDLDEGVYVSLKIRPRGSSREGRPQARGHYGARHRGGRYSGRQGRDSDRNAGATLRARLDRIIGDPGKPNIETDVVAAHFEIPDHWPEDVLAAEQEWLSRDASAGLRAEGHRKDLRRLTTFTIDGATARDFDDALSVEITKRETKVWVHIADVSHYVRPGSAIDVEAQRRGTSVYFADRAVHMLPKGLSENLCSLRPDCDRFALSVEMTFDQTGLRTAARVMPTLIRSDARLTYRQVEESFESSSVIEPRVVGEALEVARGLVDRLLLLREERGAFEIEQEVGAFSVGQDGLIEDYQSTPRLFAHRLIEEFMIQANVAVAEIATRRLAQLEAHGRDGREGPDGLEGLGASPTFLFRQHSPPKPMALQELIEQVTALGIRLPTAEIETVGDLADLLDAVGDRPVRGFVESLLLRSLNRAIYVPRVAEHFALGLDAYCHFTSPIRRYPDLVDHRCMKVLLFDDLQHQPTGGAYSGDQELAERLSELEQRAERAEREQFRWRMVRWLSDREGDRLPVTVTNVQTFGLFVSLDGLGIDGLIPFSDVPGGEIEMRTEGVEVAVSDDRNREPQVYRLGDSLEATLVSADETRRQLLLSFDSGGPGNGARGKGRETTRPRRRARDGRPAQDRHGSRHGQKRTSGPRGSRRR